jgi:hypothetical protein
MLYASGGKLEDHRKASNFLRKSFRLAKTLFRSLVVVVYTVLQTDPHLHPLFNPCSGSAVYETGVKTLPLTEPQKGVFLFWRQKPHRFGQ